MPAGTYEFKVRLNGSWDENYGAGGVRKGGNIPLPLEYAAGLSFSYDHATHRVGVAPTDAARRRSARRTRRSRATACART